MSATEAASELRGLVRGAVLVRGDADLPDAVAGFNATAEVDPEIAVVAAHENDVVAAVRVAAAHGLGIRVQSTGHGAYLPVTGGVLIVTGGLDSVAIDEDAGTVTVGAGVRWRDVLPALRGTGRTLLTGSAPTVGIVGIALGGGFGPLSRSFGTVADHVLSFRLVTADAVLTDVSADQHPDLFWALRGGKLGLGVVVAVTLELLSLDSIRAGGLFWDAADALAVLPTWLERTRSAPSTINSSVNLVRFPDLPGVPDAVRGRHLLHLRFALADPATSSAESAELADAWLAPLRAAAHVVLDTVGDLSPSDVGTIHGDPEGPMPTWDRGVFLDDLGASQLERLVQTVGQDERVVVLEVRHLGGELDAVGTATGGRGARYALFVIGAPVPELFPALPAVWDGARAIVADSVYPVTNYHWLGKAPAADYAAAWDDETTARLTAVRRTYDAAGVFDERG